MQYIIFFISILAHELGHLIIGKMINVNFGKLTFGIMGFSITEANFSSIRNSRKILICLSGPLFNFLIASLFVFFPIKYQKEFIFTNLFLGILNMLPIIPLDGGNILICILRYKFSLKKSIKISIIIGKSILFLLSLIYCIAILMIKNIWILILIIYLWKIFLEEEYNFRIYFKIQEKIKNVF